MCGIAGVVEVDGRRPLDGLRLAGHLRHRGPDSVGAFDGDGGSIAQSRLAIIDLATGDPPITNEDGTVAAVSNGEIYNFRSLRADLQARGHAFTTTCDTEVLVHLAEDHGPDVEHSRMGPGGPMPDLPRQVPDGQ